MKRLSILLNALLIIIIIILLFQLSNRNKIILDLNLQNEVIENDYLNYKTENHKRVSDQEGTIDTLNIDLKRLTDMMEDLEVENNKLIQEIDNLITIDAASIEGLKNQGIIDYKIIGEDIFTHPELIKFDGVLGGTMFFTHAYVLNDKWVYARFEDGHIQGYGIYEFNIEEDLTITWKVIDAILD